MQSHAAAAQLHPHNALSPQWRLAARGPQRTAR
jgi:hypothetical protein